MFGKTAKNPQSWHKRNAPKISWKQNVISWVELKPRISLTWCVFKSQLLHAPNSHQYLTFTPTISTGFTSQSHTKVINKQNLKNTKMNSSKQFNDVIMKDQRNEAILFSFHWFFPIFANTQNIGPIFIILGGFLVSNKFVALWILFFQNWYRQIILFPQPFIWAVHQWKIPIMVAVGDCNSQNRREWF